MRDIALKQIADYIQTSPFINSDRSTFTPEKIIASAQKILAPYTLEVPEIDWWALLSV